MTVGTVSITTAGYGPAALEMSLNDRNDSANTGKYKIRQYAVTTPQPEIAYHVPDEGEERIIRLEDGDRVAEFLMTVYGGGDRDTLDSNINDLRRTIREASRHELDDAFPLYYLTTQPNSASNATYHDIKAGWLDDSRSHWTAVGELNVIAYETVLYLILSPYGYRDTITLENYLPSSAHFLEDSDSDGLADGWNEVGSPTTTLDTATTLIGHQTQAIAIAASATTQGIQSDVVTAAQSSFLNAFVWLRTSNGCDPIRVRIVDGSNNVVATKTFVSNGDVTGVADYSTVERTGGFTWYRISLAGVNSTAANARLQIIRLNTDSSAHGTFYVDGAYLNVGLVTAPTDGWISSRRTENVNSLDTEADINYCDVWGIPGDADAVAVWKLEAQGIGIGFYMGRMTDGKTRASEQIHWLDSADGTGTNGSGTWSTAASASYAGGSAARFTEGVGATGGYFEWTLSGNAARKFARTPRRVVLVGAVETAGAVDATFLLGVYGDSGNTDFASHNITTSFTLQHTAPGTALLDLGTINLAGVLPDDVPDTTEPDIVIRVTIAGLASGEIANIDALFLAPVVDDFMVYHILDGNAWAASDLWIDGDNKTVTPEARGFDRHDWQGSMWTLAPGPIMNRIVFMQFYTADFTVNYASGFNWKLDVIPRGRHLIGSR